MSPVPKKQRQSQNSESLDQHLLQIKQRWDQRLSVFEKAGLKNYERRSRSVEEKKCILNAMKMMLSYQLRLVEEGKISVHDISWTQIEDMVSKAMSVRRQMLCDLRLHLFEDGKILPGHKRIKNNGTSAGSIDEDAATAVQVPVVPTEQNSQLLQPSIATTTTTATGTGTNATLEQETQLLL